jgi:hypothetical protein
VVNQFPDNKLSLVNLVRFVALVQLTVAASCAIAWAGEAEKLALPKVVVGQSNEVCGAAVKVIRKIKNVDFWNGAWRNRFGSIDWIEGADQIVTTERRHADVHFKYIAIDISNDERPDVVVIYTASFRSVDWDWLYLFDPKQFSAAQKEGMVEKLFEEVPKLNPRNVVQFINGQSGVPVELHLWRYKGATFILAKEHYFAKKEPDVPSSFFVAKLGSQSSKWDDVFKVQRLVPELTCRIVAK